MGFTAHLRYGQKGCQVKQQEHAASKKRKTGAVPSLQKSTADEKQSNPQEYNDTLYMEQYTCSAQIFPA